MNRYDMTFDLCCRAFGFTKEGRQKLEIMLALLDEAREMDGQESIDENRTDAVRTPAMAATEPAEKARPASGKKMHTPRKPKKLETAAYDEQIAPAVLAHIKAKGIAQTRLAADTGIPYKTLNMILTGVQKCRGDYAARLRAWLDGTSSGKAAGGDEIDKSVKYILGE